MSVAALVFLALGAVTGDIGVRVEHLEGLSSDQGEALAQAIAQVAEVAASQPAKLDARGAPACAAKDICARDVRVRTGAGTVLFVSAYGAVSKIALFLEVHEENKKPVEKRVDLEIAERAWRPALVRALTGFLPKAAKKEPPPIALAKPAQREEKPSAAREPAPSARRDPPAPPEVAAREQPPPAAATPIVAKTSGPKVKTSTVLQWTTVGVGAVMAITGTVLAASSFGAQSDLDAMYDRRDEQGLIDGIHLREAEDEASSIGTQRTVGLALGLAGAAAVAGGLVWMLSADDGGSVSAALAPNRGGGSLVVAGTF